MSSRKLLIGVRPQRRMLRAQLLAGAIVNRIIQHDVNGGFGKECLNSHERGADASSVRGRDGELIGLLLIGPTFAALGRLLGKARCKTWPR